MFFRKLTALVLCLSVTLAATSIHRTGWLDNVVQFYKNHFLTDLKTVVPVHFNATIRAAPPGYVDAPGWDYQSVTKLLTLIAQCKTAGPVRRALRRSFGPTRRFMNKKQSLYFFPSLAKKIPDDIYYDVSSSSDYEFHVPSGVPDDDAIIIVSNPVEARLPSGRISVKLLRDILDARALAGKVMPTTTRSTIPWKSMNKTTRYSELSTTPGNDTDGTTAETSPEHQTTEEPVTTSLVTSIVPEESTTIATNQ